ncbi:MAG TPA: ABC transporter permease [Acidobacteriaceae bacterium]|nr:ABC transporter permease [Acidobacteriaceae bacterium]
MQWMTNILTGLKSLFHKQQVENELDEELESYVQASAAEKVKSGMSPENARHAALVELGSRNVVKHQVWSSRWESTLDSLLLDMKISLRTLAKSPGFTAIALLSIALGIGANTAIFTLIHQVILRDLPVRDPQQLVTFGTSTGGGILGGVDLGVNSMFPWSFAHQLQSNPGPFQGIASYSSFAPTVSVLPPSSASAHDSASSAVLVRAVLVSGNYFSVLGAQPLFGRTINPSDNTTPGSGAVVVLSEHFWRQSLSADPDILGKTITINRTPFTVIGVMPRQFHGIKLQIDPAALWTPIMMQSVILQQPSFLGPDAPYFLEMFARLSPAASTSRAALEQSQLWLNQQIHAGVRATESGTISAARQQEINRLNLPLISAQRGVSSMRGQYGSSLIILMAVVILVLLIACANLANFLLARAATRQREIATRLALGSSRRRIIRQSLMEALSLSMVGGLIGLGIAFAATRALIAFVSQGSTNTTLSSTPDATVLLFTLAASLFTGLLFGLAPAIVSARTGAAGSLSSNARTAQSSQGRASRLWPKMLVTAQIILSLLLLVGAGLFLRSLRNLQQQDYGFNRTHLLLADFDPKIAGYKSTQMAALDQQLIDRLSALPGVRSVALANTLPIQLGTEQSSFKISGYTPAPKEDMSSTIDRVSSRYFQTVGVPILSGRSILPSDTASSFKVVVVSESLAKHFFPKGDAVGHILTIDDDNIKGPWQIVGVAKDTRSGNPRDKTSFPTTYLPLAQIDPWTTAANAFADPAPASAANSTPTPREENQDAFASSILVRTSGDPAQSATELRAAVRSIDPSLPVHHIITIHDQISSLMTHDELIATLTGLFSVLALLLTTIGLFGVMSYNVVRRTNEIGIRFALGARRTTVLWMILRESLLLLAFGIGVGIPLALGAARLVRQQLYGLGAIDPATCVTAIAVVIVMTLFAAWLPAQRATKVDPMIALRCD